MNNLVLFSGADSFNQMVGFLESIKPLIRVMEFGLLAILVTHTFNAIKLTYENKMSRNTISYGMVSDQRNLFNQVNKLKWAQKVSN